MDNCCDRKYACSIRLGWKRGDRLSSVCKWVMHDQRYARSLLAREQPLHLIHLAVVISMAHTGLGNIIKFHSLLIFIYFYWLPRQRSRTPLQMNIPFTEFNKLHISLNDGLVVNTLNVSDLNLGPLKRQSLPPASSWITGPRDYWWVAYGSQAHVKPL
jgi:hypothetical protein